MGAHARAEQVSIVISVMGSMMGGFREGRIQVADSRHLWNVLVTIVLNKTRKRVEQGHSAESQPSDLEDQLSKDAGQDALAMINESIQTPLRGWTTSIGRS